MRHGADDTFELYVVQDEELASTQATFTVFPHTQKYASRDLFVRHLSPSEQDMWKLKARADEIIVFLNGGKANPVSTGQHIVSSNAEVTVTMVFGAQRFQACLLVELPPEAMMHAGKGTIQRAGTLRAYQHKIDAFYKVADEMLDDDASPTLALHDVANQASLSQYITELIMSITGWPELSESKNIFALGMHSLHAIPLARNLNQALRIPDLAPRALNTNPSVTALFCALIALREENQGSQNTAHPNHLSRRNALLQEYKGKINRLHPQSATAHGSIPHMVVLMGSTGAVVSYIMKCLLENLAGSHIYCLNRAADGLSLQMSRN
ncbi:MAG: hypothetical protein Q9184_006432 [Pyrenodesmia sp. 2 TL-2023]